MAVISFGSSKIWGLQKRRVGRQMTLDEWAVLDEVPEEAPQKATPFLQDRRASWWWYWRRERTPSPFPQRVGFLGGGVLQ